MRVIKPCQLAQDAAAVLLNNGETSLYPELLLSFNASQQEVTFDLPEGTWAVLADGECSMLWQKPEKTTGKATIQPMAALILGKVKA